MKYILLIISCLILSACPGVDMPKIDISLWAGDSEITGVTRAQAKKSIACNDPQFDEFVCLTLEDLKKIYSTMLKCSKWSSETSEANTKAFIDNNPEIHQNLFKKRAPVLDHESKQNL